MLCVNRTETPYCRYRGGVSFVEGSVCRNHSYLGLLYLSLSLKCVTHLSHVGSFTYSRSHWSVSPKLSFLTSVLTSRSFLCFKVARGSVLTLFCTLTTSLSLGHNQPVSSSFLSDMKRTDSEVSCPSPPEFSELRSQTSSDPDPMSPSSTSEDMSKICPFNWTGHCLF